MKIMFFLSLLTGLFIFGSNLSTFSKHGESGEKDPEFRFELKENENGVELRYFSDDILVFGQAGVNNLSGEGFNILKRLGV